MQADPFIDNYRFLAQYNRWFNQRLYDACEKLSDEERKRDRGAFFGSIHNTLNHIVWGDQLWLQRFAASGTPFPSLSSGLRRMSITHGSSTGRQKCVRMHPIWPATRPGGWTGRISWRSSSDE